MICETKCALITLQGVINNARNILFFSTIVYVNCQEAKPVAERLWDLPEFYGCARIKFPLSLKLAGDEVFFVQFSIFSRKQLSKLQHKRRTGWKSIYLCSHASMQKLRFEYIH